MSENLLTLLPMPREIEYRGGTNPLRDSKFILLDSDKPQGMRFAASRLQDALRKVLSLNWELVASRATPVELVGVRLRIGHVCELKPQGYMLTIMPDVILIEAWNDEGIYYGICTLIQILDRYGRNLPCLHIRDWPDFQARGVMLDISRDKVYKLETLKGLVDMLSSWKVNQLQLYMEHTFAYQRHPEVWSRASPMTGEEILDLDSYCRERFIELIPNQNSFGHMNRWLIHPQYKELAEAPEGFEVPWGWIEGPFSLNPLDPRSFQLVQSLFDELLPHFNSRIFNVGCDETFDLGKGKSKALCQQIGKGRVYLDYLRKIYEDVKSRGYTMMFWGDIIIQHPDLIPELPRDVIALEWGYDANHPFAERTELYANTGIPFYVCPGTSAWNSLAGRSDNALANLYNAAESGLKHGAVGYLNTDWGDNGHWQTLPVSWLGFAAGAAYSWALESNTKVNFQQALGWYAFRDKSGVMGKVAYDLGNVYRSTGIELENDTVLFEILQRSIDDIKSFSDHITVPYENIYLEVDHIIRSISEAQFDNLLPPLGGKVIICREFELVAHMLKRACLRGMLASEEGPSKIIELQERLDKDLPELLRDYQEVWLVRNRPGGLEDSITRFR